LAKIEKIVIMIPIMYGSCSVFIYWIFLNGCQSLNGVPLWANKTTSAENLAESLTQKSRLKWYFSVDKFQKLFQRKFPRKSDRGSEKLSPGADFSYIFSKENFGKNSAEILP
jgi:hypothetical protein